LNFYYKILSSHSLTPIVLASRSIEPKNNASNDHDGQQNVGTTNEVHFEMVGLR
jgi:hypothetical protein